MKYINSSILSIAFLSMGLTSCEKLIDVGNPLDKVASDFVYSRNSTAPSVLSGLYFDIQREYSGIAQGRSGLSFQCGLSADEFKVTAPNSYENAYNNYEYWDYWTPLYSYVYRANAAIEGLTASNTISQEIKNQLLGEAFFMRAFFYFYLVNLYGHLPIITSTDYKANSLSPQSESQLVYIQIESDLINASRLLRTSYIDRDAFSITTERVRPSKWAALSLLSRVYLYKQKWSDAEMCADSVINNNTLFSLENIDEVFKKNSDEAIWQIQTSTEDAQFLNPLDASLFILINGVPDYFVNPVSLNQSLVDLFGNTDQRKLAWIGIDSSTGDKYYYPYKYKNALPGAPQVEYLMVLRLAEQYLIRAEARAQQGKLIEATNDLNTLRERAGAVKIGILSKDDVLRAIITERRLELFTEWGHRWLDLRRLHLIDQVIKEVKPNSWKPYMQLYPIPIRDLLYNPNLKQNAGYPST